MSNEYDQYNSKKHERTVNRQDLIPNKDGYAEVVFFSDLHYGSRYTDIDKAAAMLKYCYDNNVYVFIMGDSIEMSSRHSVGAGWADQIMTPQEQIEGIIELYKPLAEKKLIVGYLTGNHELRAYKNLGLDISSIICNILNLDCYLGYAGWSIFYIQGKEKTTGYKIYTSHGSGAAKKEATKLNTVLSLADYFAGDLVACGHTHTLVSGSVERQDLDMKTKAIIHKKQYGLVCGSYQRLGGYSLHKSLPPTKLGSPKVLFYANRKDIHIRL